MTLAQLLAQHCARSVADTDLERATLHMVAWTGAAAMAASAPSAPAFWNGLQGLSPTEDPWQIFLFEASLGSLFELDDTHRQALVHPAPIIVPSALATARQCHATGRDLLDAMVRGYEAMIRMGMSVGPAHYRHWHNTSTCGAVGAAVAAASLLHLTEDQTAHAICLALVQASGLWQTRLDPCDAKPWHLARAAQTGVQSAYLAHNGLTGPARAFEGEKGFFAATCPDAQPHHLYAPVDAGWEIHATSFKPWAACRHAHPVIDAAMGLRHTWQLHPHELPWAQVKSIEIHTYDDAIGFCDRPSPLDAGQARFSLQHAVALTQGSPSPAAFDTGCLAAPQSAALRAATRLHANAEFNRRYPQHFGATVTVHWHDGTHLSHTVTDTLGDPERPLSLDALTTIADSALAYAGWTQDARTERLLQTRALLHDTTGAWINVLTPLRPL